MTWSNSWNNELQDYVDDGAGGQNAFLAPVDGPGSNKALVTHTTRTAASNTIHSFSSARLVTQGRVTVAPGKGNLAVGGFWPGAPDGSTVFPQDLFVDWVRVYR